MRRIVLATLAGMLLLGAGAPADKARTLREGVYTEAQAARGATRYAQNCARCHGADLLGTYDIPSLRGTLIAHWSGAPLGGLYDYVSRAMPMQAPGALSAAINADILAFVLKANGYPAGPTELAPEAATMTSIKIVAPDPR